ncbi:hypothetical protein F4814DRAFT_383637 [Daldinia grandis]|nr:hypothetical protein F4814DRAFT_383637 [Daldinia grandis]
MSITKTFRISTHSSSLNVKALLMARRDMEQTIKRASESENHERLFRRRMFIYAKLVLQIAKDQETLYDIEIQMENLPDGLDQAYGRLLDRIKSGLTQVHCDVVRTILQWEPAPRGP